MHAPPWRNILDGVSQLSRRPSVWLAVALAAGGSALVAGTWLVAQLNWQARLRTLEAELSLYRSTRHLDMPRLLGDLERLAGPAADRLAFQELKQRHATLEREHQLSLGELRSLRRNRRLEERFRLTAGSAKDLLEGKVPLQLEGVEDSGVRVSLAGGAAGLWRPGDFRDLNFGGGRYRLTLETIPSGTGGQAEFRLDALLDQPSIPSSAASSQP